MIRTLATILCGLAFITSIAVTIQLLNVPLYHGFESHCTVNGCETIQSTQTLVAVNGARVIGRLALVTLVSGAPLFVTLRRSSAQRLVTWVCTLLLMAYSIAGSMTIGFAFMPSAILLLLAAIVTLFIHQADFRTPATILSGLALLLSIAATIYLLNAPFYQHTESQCTGSCDANNHCIESCDTTQVTRTFVEEYGVWLIYQLVAATLISGIPLFFALRRSASQPLATWVSALLILAYAIAGRLTIGLVFVPSASLLLIVAVVTLFIRKEADQ